MWATSSSTLKSGTETFQGAELYHGSFLQGLGPCSEAGTGRYQGNPGNLWAAFNKGAKLIQKVLTINPLEYEIMNMGMAELILMVLTIVAHWITLELEMMNITDRYCHDERGSCQNHSMVLSHSDEDGHGYLSPGQRHHRSETPGFFKAYQET